MMTISVKLWRGEWKKNGEEEWHFQPDDDDIGVRVTIIENEMYDILVEMLDDVSTGLQNPPTTIYQTEDLCVLLNVTTSLSDLGVLVSIGPKRVAEYEFLCRTDFRIGSTTYVVDDRQAEENRGEYERLVFGDRVKETERVMNTLFTEQTLMLFHRVSCEMAYADNCLRLGGNTNQPSREVIVVEDDDDVMYEADNANNGSGLNTGHGAGPPTLMTNLVSVPIGQAQAPSIFWDVGMDVRNFHEQSNPVSNVPATENKMRFWETVIGGGFAIDADLNINGPAEVDVQNVGGIIQNENADVAPVSNEVVVPNIVDGDIGDADGGGSSTGSSRNVGSVVGYGDGGIEAAVVAPLNIPVRFSHDNQGNCGRVGEGIRSTPATEEGPVLSPPDLQVPSSQARLPIFKFTSTSHTGEASGVKKADKGIADTASEGSDNDGGF
ncbi:hypothetical protein Bca101_067288 [Brassica carinata]